MDTAANNTIFQERIQSLRAAMQQHQLDAYIVLTADLHLSEYLPEFWQSRRWLSGFDGSAGTLVVTQNFAGLWTDSRYWTQAEKQLAGTGIVLQKLSSPQNTHIQWLLETLPENSCVGIDGATLSVTAKNQLLECLNPKHITLNTTLDLMDIIWPERPPLPKQPIYPHKLTFCAQARMEKIIAIRQAMLDKGANWHLLSALDDIAWLTNSRGSDVSYNPVFLAHMLISMDQAFLFVDSDKLSESLALSLTQDDIELKPYDAIIPALAKLEENACLLFDPQKTSTLLINALPQNVNQIMDINPSTFAKSCKKEEDLLHTRHAMEEDGAALCEFFSELEAIMAENKTITELTIDEKLTACRAQREHFVSLSFSTIAAFNENGAQPHYRATQESHSVIEGNGLLLIDSGAQYYDGTTDITRVIPVGEPSCDQKRDFTLVLKAHIALASASFPEGIKSPLLDAIARAPLWAEHIDFGHGTGHGVGYFLNVHEGPQVLSFHTPVTPQTEMKVGMITSIEPGLYRPGQWGIRIENLVATVAVEQPKEADFGRFLRFETLTLCPIDTRCIDASLLDQKEIDWLNTYHQEVFKRLGHKLSGNALDWLAERTRPLENTTT